LLRRARIILNRTIATRAFGSEVVSWQFWAQLAPIEQPRSIAAGGGSAYWMHALTSCSNWTRQLLFWKNSDQRDERQDDETIDDNVGSSHACPRRAHGRRRGAREPPYGRASQPNQVRGSS